MDSAGDDNNMQNSILQQKAGITTFASGLAMVVIILVVQHLAVSSLILPGTGTITLSEEQEPLINI